MILLWCSRWSIPVWRVPRFWLTNLSQLTCLYRSCIKKLSWYICLLSSLILVRPHLIDYSLCLLTSVTTEELCAIMKSCSSKDSNLSRRMLQSFSASDKNCSSNSSVRMDLNIVTVCWFSRGSSSCRETLTSTKTFYIKSFCLHAAQITTAPAGTKSFFCIVYFYKWDKYLPFH